MSGLRRILGDNLHAPEYIATIVGRGYQFVDQGSHHHQFLCHLDDPFPETKGRKITKANNRQF